MIRRFFFGLFLMVSLALSGYNAWQIHALQKEMSGLQANLSILARHRADRNAERSASSGPALSDLDLADLHVQRAREEMAKGDFGAAQGELTKAVDDVQRTAAGPEEQTRATVAHARSTLSALQTQADRLWHDLQADRAGTH